MLDVRLSRSADADLFEIVYYTAERFGEAQSEIYSDGLLAAIDLLSEYPLIGTDASDVRASTRRLVHEHHNIFYEVLESEVLVLRILGPGQDPQEHLSVL